MEKEKKIMIVTISIMALILVCVIFMQFKVVNETDIAQIESMREEELEESLAEWKEKYQEAYKKLVETNDKINEYEEKMQSNAETKELVNKELTEAKRNFGLTTVEGEGIIVTLNDTDEMAYDAEDLLDLVNELRDAGAEAISINDERIINMSDIVNIATRYIKVNSEKISSPYVIKAIGDRTYLKSALTIKNGYVDLKEKNEYKIKIEEKNSIKINKYSKDVSLQYINLNLKGGN